MSTKDRIKSILFLLLAVLCTAYYLLCIAWAWIGVSWLWIWPLAAAFCLLRFFMLRKGFSAPKWLKIAYRAALAAFVCAFIFIEGLVISAMDGSPVPELDYVVVLGAAVRGREPTTPLKLRMYTALDYLEQNPDTLCIASGGKGPGEDISEARCIKDFLVSSGISEDRIILEDRSHDTMENIRNTYEIIGSEAELGIITNGFHLYRAQYIARLQGHRNTFGIPSPTLLPLGIHYTVREFFGMVKLLLKSISSPGLC